MQDREALVTALSKLEAKGPMGVTKFDENRGIVTDFFLLKVGVGSDGTLQNSCIDRMPQVEDPYKMFPK